MGKDFAGPATEPEVAGATEGEETLVGRLGESDFDRTGVRRSAASAPDSVEIEMDLARTHSSEIPAFLPTEPRLRSEPPVSALPHSAILPPVETTRSPEPAEDDDDEPPMDATSAWRAPPRADPREMIGKVVAGRYRLGPVLGAGGMGTVFKAQHTDLGKHVAIKVLAAILDGHDEAKQRFLREAKAASTIESEHIAQVFDIGEDFHLGLYMVMDLLKGEDLSHVLAAQGALEPEAAAGIAWQVSLALERAHAAGVVHRDLKPANVFLTRGDDGSAKVKVLDFGIAKLLRDARQRRGGITQSGYIVGTPQYMSPEQAQGLPSVDHRTDVYSLGALLFECITGTAPYPEHESHQHTLYTIITQPPPRLASLAPSVAPALDQLVADLMARDPEKRPGSAKEVRARLVTIFPALGRRTLNLGEGTSAPAPVAVVPRTGSGITVDSTMDAPAAVVRRPRPALLAAAAALMVTTLVVAFLVVTNRPATNLPGQPTTLTAAQAGVEVPLPAAMPMPPATGVGALATPEAGVAEPSTK